MLIKKWSLWTWASIVGAGVIVGLLTGPLVLIPRVTVSPSSALDPSDPFSAPFIISNDSIFAIYDVKFSCDFKNASLPNDIEVIDSSFGSAIAIPVIEPNEKATTEYRIAFPPANKNSIGDISIVTSYQPRFWFRREEKRDRFQMKQGSDKQWYWLPQPAAK